MKKKILHITNNSVFARGYIEFMNSLSDKYMHEFVVMRRGPFADEKGLYKNVRVIEKDKLAFVLGFYKETKEYEKVIYTGVWNTFVIACMSFFPKSFMKKLYLHFWGGDFYAFRDNEKKKTKDKIRLFFTKRLIKRACGVVFLIPEEREQFRKILNLEKKSFVAPMPASPSETEKSYEYYRELEKKWAVKQNGMQEKEYRIMIGHSASPDCCHEEVFRKIRRFSDRDIKIICPLSYGDAEYANQVMKMGENLFPGKFEAITEFMPIEEYRELLCGVDMAIFLMNRQQGLGNIYIILGAGNKLILRSGTAMWKWFEKNKYKVCSEKELEKNFQEFCEFHSEARKNNMHLIQRFYKDGYEDAKKKWEDVFEY